MQQSFAKHLVADVKEKKYEKVVEFVREIKADLELVRTSLSSRILQRNEQYSEIVISVLLKHGRNQFRTMVA